MTVYFIGAGPGAADLITVRGQRLIARAPVCLYAGSLVPAELLADFELMLSDAFLMLGSHLMAGGFLLNNELTDFSLDPAAGDRVKPADRQRIVRALECHTADRYADTPSNRNADVDGVMHYPGFHEEATLMLREVSAAVGIAVDTLSLDLGVASSEDILAELAAAIESIDGKPNDYFTFGFDPWQG